MAQFDLKNAYIRFTDGRLAVLTTTAAAGVNGRFTLTDKSTHRGTRTAITLVIVIGGISTALSIGVVGTIITVTGATDGAGVGTSTAAQVKTAIEASVAASALVTVTLPGTGAALVSAQASTPLATGPRTLQLKVFEGRMSYVEKKERKYVLDRGKLGTVQNGDEVPVEVKIDVQLEFVTASSGLTATPEDVLKNRGEAAAWLTTDTDPCNPYCIDVEVEYDPTCSGVKREFLMLECFRNETGDHKLKDGALMLSGKCNVTEPSDYRIT